MKIVNFTLVCGALAILGCLPETGQTDSVSVQTPENRVDQHSFARPAESVTTNLSLDLTVDFEQKVIYGVATHDIQNNGSDTFVLDMRDLEILRVHLDDDPEAVTPVYTQEEGILGQGLKIPVLRDTRRVVVAYRTTPEAAALGWLEPVQTADNTMPFLYTQGQAILTRTWIPVQDSPGIRMTYEATIHVPPGMMAAMSATNPQQRIADGVYRFEMKQPVPAYLIALAVGDFDFAPIGARTGVYAEPSMLKRSVYELADMEKMLEIAEGLYGPYQWDRYDVIILPPSFPFGGMENPRLTFATPTIIAGDRSLVSLIAHEMAHSWSGNLVTNATWNDFWLNEGFTTYFENRIMEALYGVDYAKMLALLGYQDLQDAIADMGKDHQDTHLFLDLKGRDPDDGMNSIAYDKGALFLRTLEAGAGREKFDRFLQGYFEKHKFESMTTGRFVEYLIDNLLQPEGLDINIDAWINGPGIPMDAHVLTSDKFTKVDSVTAAFVRGDGAKSLTTAEWTTHEWLHFIRHLPGTLSEGQMADLDVVFGLTSSGNAEIAAAWYELALRNVPSGQASGYADQIMPEIEKFLFDVGRRKFLMPIYRAMKETGRKDAAVQIFTRCRANYHAVSQSSLDDLLST